MNCSLLLGTQLGETNAEVLIPQVQIGEIKCISRGEVVNLFSSIRHSEIQAEGFALPF